MATQRNPAKAPDLTRDLVAFKRVGTVREDGRGRVSLGTTGRSHKPDAYQHFVGEHGEILLVPVKEVPERELWLWQNAQALASVQRGLAQAATGQSLPFDMGLLAGASDDEA